MHCAEGAPSIPFMGVPPMGSLAMTAASDMTAAAADEVKKLSGGGSTRVNR
jgi:hypothetical protein